MIANKPEIINVIQKEGVALTLRGRTFWGLCPFHPEKTPSFAIDTKRQRGRCFGCGWSGDVLDYVQQRHGLSFKEALAYLGIESGRPSRTKIAEAQERKELLVAFREWEREFSNLLAAAVRLYRQREAAGFSWAEAQALADVINDIPYVEHLYEEIFCKGDEEAKLQIFKQEYGL